MGIVLSTEWASKGWSNVACDHQKPDCDHGHPLRAPYSGLKPGMAPRARRTPVLVTSGARGALGATGPHVETLPFWKRTLSNPWAHLPAAPLDTETAPTGQHHPPPRLASPTQTERGTSNLPGALHHGSPAPPAAARRDANQASRDLGATPGQFVTNSEPHGHTSTRQVAASRDPVPGPSSAGVGHKGATLLSRRHGVSATKIRRIT